QYAWQGRQAFLNFKVSLQPACKLCSRFGQHPIVGLEFNHLVGIEITFGLQSRVIVRRDFSSRSKELSLQLLHSQRILGGGFGQHPIVGLEFNHLVGIEITLGLQSRVIVRRDFSSRSKELSLQLLHLQRILGGGSTELSLQLLHSQRILGGGSTELSLQLLHSQRILGGGSTEFSLQLLDSYEVGLLQDRVAQALDDPQYRFLDCGNHMSSDYCVTFARV